MISPATTWRILGWPDGLFLGLTQIGMARPIPPMGGMWDDPSFPRFRSTKLKFRFLDRSTVVDKLKKSQRMELKYDSGIDFVNLSSHVEVKKTNVVLNGKSHDLELRYFGEGKGFQVSIRSPVTCYYLQIDGSKKFEGIGFDRKNTFYTTYTESPNTLKMADMVLNTSLNSLLQLFEDTFFTKKSYSSFEFLVEDKSRKASYSWPPKKYYKSAMAKRKRLSESEILYLRIYVKLPNDVNHLVNDLMYFFTFLSMPNINASNLPDEIFLEVFSFLGVQFLLVKVNCVCKRFHNLIESEFMSRIIFQKMFPGITDKPNPKATWKQNIHEKFCSLIRWESCLPYDYLPDWPATDFFERVNGSPTHAILGRLLDGPDMIYWTNKYVSAADSHEWKVRLKLLVGGVKSRWYGSKMIGIKKESWKITPNEVMVDSGFGMLPCYYNSVISLDIGSGVISHKGSNLAYTNGGFYRSRWGEQYGDYDPREHHDFGLFSDGGIITMKLSAGKLEFEFPGSTGGKKVSCDVPDTKQRYCLCLRCQDLEAEIVSFKKIVTK